MKHFGLIGQSLKHSFSKKYFEEKFGATDSLYTYQLYELGTIGEVADLIYNERLSGFNVTIPYKQTILPYIDELSDEALQVGAVNAVKVEHSQMGKPYLKGYNTDVYGFEQSLQPLLNPNHIYALILGTGGASKALAYVLDKLNIGYKFVSRQSRGENMLSYSDVDSSLLTDYHLVINATPQGMYPDVDQCPDIDYEGLTPMHLCYDLVYNPYETLFMDKAMQHGATVKNGMQMLQLQAEKSWEIWNII